MDLNTIETVVTVPTRAALTGWRPGDAWLAGGSWLFSEPQVHLRRLFDLQGFGWPPLTVTADGLEIAATCSIATLQRWSGAPADWTAAALIEPCCRALLGSFKVWTVATVGGNLCLALPAGPMTALAVALEGRCLIWTPDGQDRTLEATAFVVGDRRNALRPGELLRSVLLPVAALRRHAAVRQISLSPLGRSGALLIGTRDPAGAFALTVTASTRRPFRLAFPKVPAWAELAEGIAETIREEAWHDDVHGHPAWRRHVTGVLAAEILAELGGQAA